MEMTEDLKDFSHLMASGDNSQDEEEENKTIREGFYFKFLSSLEKDHLKMHYATVTQFPSFLTIETFP